MILEKLVVGPFASNCYIVGSEVGRVGMVIDPGDEGKRITGNIEKLGLDIKFIVLTHSHIDHIGAVKAVQEFTGAEIAIHIDEAKALSKQGGPLTAMLGVFYPSSPPPDRLLKDGDSLDIGDIHFKVLHTPGHTPGGICLLGPGILFSGDTLFAYGIGRTDFHGGNYNQLINSIQSRLMALSDDTVVYPGHGPETTIGNERQGNPFLHG